MELLEAHLRMLMIAGLSGSTAAYQRLLEGAADRLRAYFARRLRPDDANLEDLVQDTLLAIHQRRESYDQSLPFTPWLHAIARHKLVDHLRRRGAAATVALEEMGEIAEPDMVDARLAAADVERLLAELTEKQRLAITLTRIRGHWVAEAAAMAGQSPSAIKVGVHRGIHRLIALVRSFNDRD